MFLLTQQVKTLATDQQGPLKFFSKDYQQLLQAQWVLGTRRYPMNHKYFLYRHFHNHLPEQLFFEDFEAALKEADKQTQVFSSIFKQVDGLPDEQAKLETLQEALAKVTCMELVRDDDPVVRRLALYVLAHRNYLATLPFEVMRDFKVNWGLRKTHKLADGADSDQGNNTVKDMLAFWFTPEDWDRHTSVSQEAMKMWFQGGKELDQYLTTHYQTFLE